MPIHDQGYRRYRGTRSRYGAAWWVIARHGLRARLAERRFIALLLAAWLPFLVRTVQIYVSINFSQVSFWTPTAQMFRDFLGQQEIFVFFVTMFAGAGLIANDRRANALQIYLSKPLTRTEYVAGKLTTLMLFLAAVTWVPALLLLVVQVVFSGSLAFVRANAFVIPAITVFAAVQIVLSALAVLALSSLSKSSRFVATLFAGLVFFSAATYQALRAVTGSDVWVWMSPRDIFDVVGDGLFRTNPGGDSPFAIAAAAIVVFVAASIWVLERRVRAVEVVS